MFSTVYNVLSQILSVSVRSPLPQKEWLHDDAWIEVFNHLEPRELARAALVCTRWRALVAHTAYSSVTLDTRTPLSSQRLVRTLRTCDHLLAQVQDITIIYLTQQTEVDFATGPLIEWLTLIPPHSHKVRRLRAIANHRVMETILPRVLAVSTIPHFELFMCVQQSSVIAGTIPPPTALDGPTLLPAIRVILNANTVKSQSSHTIRVPATFSSSSPTLPSPIWAYLEDYMAVIQDSCTTTIIVEAWYDPNRTLHMVPSSTFPEGPIACECGEFGTLAAVGDHSYMFYIVYWRAPFVVASLARLLMNLHAGRTPTGMKVHTGHWCDHPPRSEACETCGVYVKSYTTA